MPIYEYQCSRCNHRLEALQKFSDAPLKECPGCGKLELNKLVSAASFRLKGSGWYETDFKTGKKKQLADTESSTSTSAGSEKQSDSAAKSAQGNAGTKSKKVESKSE